VTDDLTQDVQLRFVEAGGARLAYRRAGSGEPLVYFHGAGLTRRWLPLYGMLARHFDVIVLEHPGFGDSPRPRWLRTMDDLALVEADAIDALGVAAFHAVGHSFGGVVAASLAALLPSRIRSLTLMAPGPLATVTPPELMPELGSLPADFDFDALLFNDRQEEYPAFRNGDDAGDLLADDPADPYADPASFDPAGAAGLYQRLRRISAPRQLLVPDEDRLFAPRTFELWAEHLGGAPVVRIGGDPIPTGHLFIVQEAGRITDAIVALACRSSGRRAMTQLNVDRDPTIRSDYHGSPTDIGIVHRSPDGRHLTFYGAVPEGVRFTEPPGDVEETFYVIDGFIRCTRPDGATLVWGPGDLVYWPYDEELKFEYSPGLRCICFFWSDGPLPDFTGGV
jgi:pimeloyl-ACP methyl ester carboxylesterase